MVNNGSVDPYNVSGSVDYSRLIKDFGLSKLDDKLLKRFESAAKKKGLDLHPMLRRGVFFAHRDLEWLFKEFDKGNKFFLYTGLGPSGPVHIGHLLVWYFTKWLQDVFDVEVYFQFTDDEKFMFKDLEFDEVQEWLHDNMLDVIAVGFNPSKTHFIVDTLHAGVMYPEAIRVAKKINFSTIKSSFGFSDSTNIGSIFFTSMQAVPSFLPSVLKGKNIPCLIPHAVDQDPHFRITRDVLPKIGRFKPASIQSSFLPPLTGSIGKMSSSDASKGILSVDSPAQVKKKINKYAFSGGRETLEEHRERGGNPDVDVPFQYLKYLFEPSDEKLSELESGYRSGSLSTGDMKKYAIGKINEFLADHQSRRSKAESKAKNFLLKV